MPALILIHPGTKAEHLVEVLSAEPTKEKRLVVEWKGSGQCQYVLNLPTNTLHKAGKTTRLCVRAGLWQAKDINEALRIWEEFDRKRRVFK